MRRRFENSSLLALVLVLLLLGFGIAQDLPKKIRGYKVHQANILVQNSDKNSANTKGFRVEMDFSEPDIAGVGLTGISLEMPASLTVFGKSGQIDFISFNDFKVNGIKVGIEEYRNKFKFKKGEKFALAKPVEIFISTPQTLRGALKEFTDSKKNWLVTGRVFVFGRFKKFGFKFKRVIPVDVELEIDNPLKKKDGK